MVKLDKNSSFDEERQGSRITDRILARSLDHKTLGAGDDSACRRAPLIKQPVDQAEGTVDPEVAAQTLPQLAVPATVTETAFSWEEIVREEMSENVNFYEFVES